MKIKILEGDFAVCKLNNLNDVDMQADLMFLSKTDKEISLVCKVEFAPKSAALCEKGWKAMRIEEGMLDFSLVGILAKLASALAEIGISIFALSTYDTDYILIKAHEKEKAIMCLEEKGYIFL